MQTDIIDTDVLIIGAGIAGCRAAIEAHDLGATVVLTTKGLFGKDSGATWMGTLGYQCWGIYPHDTLDVHAEDTLRCGWFLNNQENVYAFLAHVPDTAMELIKWGGRYKMKDGHFLPRWQLGQSIKEGSLLNQHRGLGESLDTLYQGYSPRWSKLGRLVSLRIYLSQTYLALKTPLLVRSGLTSR